MPITTRKIIAADSAVLSAIAKQSFYETFTGTCTPEDMEHFLGETFDPVKLESEIRDANNNYYFAEKDGRPVAYLLFAEDYENLPLIKQWKALELKRIYVLQEFLGKGIAQALMELYLNFARENGFAVAWLGVWEHNLRAQRFYEKYGFTNSGYTHDFPIGNTPQTDCWFWKFL